MNRHLRVLRGIIGNAAAWGLAWGAASLVVQTVLKIAHVLPYQVPLREQLFLASIFALNGALVSVAFSGYVARHYRGRLLPDLRLGRFTFAAATVSAFLMPLSGTAVRFLFWGNSSVSLQGTLIGVATGAAFGAAAAAMTLRVAQQRRFASEDDAPRLTADPVVVRLR